MITMSTKQKIILKYFREGLSQRKIARDLKISRRTIRKYISDYQNSYQEAINKNNGDYDQELANAIVEAPKYDSSTRNKRKLTIEVTGQIDKLLANNERKRDLGLHKQLMKKVDIYEALKEAGYKIGYTTVCNYITGKTCRVNEAYIRQSYLPGDICEFDWGEVKLEIAGDLRRYYMAVFTAAYSNYRYAELFHRQETTSYQQAHVNFIYHIGGVFHVMVYDNMRVAVARFVGPSIKEPTEALLKMATYYNFSFRFCNPGKGNEKGHVERSVEYIRRKAFSSRYQFASLQQANQWLKNRCEQLNSSCQELFNEEKQHLYPAFSPMECCSLEDCRVDKYSTIRVGSNWYSVPDHLVGKMLQVKIYARKITCYFEKAHVACHERKPDREQWSIKLEHYIPTLLKKPGALASSLALKNADKRLRKIYEDHFQDTPRAFIELLGYMQGQNIAIGTIEKAIEDIFKLGCRQVTFDKIITLLGQKPINEPLGQGGDIENYCKEQLKKVNSLFSLNSSSTITTTLS